MSDYEKQFQEDLERAQALSLESLALEQFKSKRLKELTGIVTNDKPKTTSVTRTASLSESDTGHKVNEKRSSKPRPRPGTSGSSSNSLIAPPPGQKRSNSISSISDSPDLISFASPPTSTSNIIQFCNQQNYSNNQLSLVTPPQRFQPWNFTNNSPYPQNFNRMPAPPGWNLSQFNNNENCGLRMSSAVPCKPVYLPSFGTVSIPGTTSVQVPPVLPPKGSKPVPPPPPPLKPTVTPSSNQDYSNSVRVSILQEFDPILSDSSGASCRTISPECGDDARSICDSVYDEYDAYDYIYTGSGSNSLSDPLYAAVVKTEVQGCSSPPPIPPRARMSTLEKRQDRKIWSLLDSIAPTNHRLEQTRDSDLKGFYEMVRHIRRQFRYNDPDTNMGLVISPMIKYRYIENLTIRLRVHPDFEGADFEKPCNFTCDVNSSIEHITLQLTCDLDAPASDKYTLKVWGYNEYLVPTTLLCDYEYVHNCIKLEEDVVLILIPDSKKDKSFARTLTDDNMDHNLKFEDVIPNDLDMHLTYDNLRILLDTVENEISKLEEAAGQIQSSSNHVSMPALQPQKVVQSIKCIVNLMGCIYTLDIMEAVDLLIKTCHTFDRHAQHLADVKDACNKIRQAISNLIEMYSQAFAVDFEVKEKSIPTSVKYVHDVQESLVLRICAVYKPSPKWKHDSYLVALQVYHGMRPVGNLCLSQPSQKSDLDTWPNRIVFDQWFELYDIPISVLARESRLVLVLYGRTLENLEEENSNNSSKYNQEEIGWGAVQFFNYEGTMVQGSILLSIWPKDVGYVYGPAPPAGSHPQKDHPMFGVEIAVPKVKFPSIAPELFQDVARGDFNNLDEETQELLEDMQSMDMLTKLPLKTRELLWDKRHYLYEKPQLLPKVLLAALSWQYDYLPDLYGMLYAWTPLSPIDALHLLLPSFPDSKVRERAVLWINKLNTDELIDYLPELVVALKLETYENSALARLLLERSLCSPRFAHYLFWLLCSNLPGPVPQNGFSEVPEDVEVKDVRNHRRLKLLLRALLAVSGESLRNCFLSQQLFVKNLNEIAESIQKTRESARMNALQSALNVLNNNWMDKVISLPLSPTLRIVGVNAKNSSYFPSKTLPLKISFVMKDKTEIPAIYKVGDDLQQDMLTLQMVRLMDKLWLAKGLDLKMVVFNCVPTGKRKGMIEMVSSSETLRKIQAEHGLTGSFKDKPIAEWLAKHNPSELEYERAVQNFTASCAGYCVATYVLGICDRHNDNIMLKTSGHLFHIDFGKFLGDAQMFGNIKRDRAPFVLTPDMVYVINQGDRPTEKFHHFVDLCCRAFNIIRNNSNLFLYLFTLMASSGISGVTIDAVPYIRNALLPDVSNPEAAAHFSKLIQSSLKSWFTQFNFFVHNLAQLKFTPEQSNGLLSFVPKVYSMATDGKLSHVAVVKFKKIYDPNKHYVYVLKVTREDQTEPMEIQRTYKEFCELHEKLCMYFPLAKLHSLTNGLHVGRSNIKQVAHRRLNEISLFIQSVFACASEIAHSDLVYTFFHPLLRDQQDSDEYSRRANRNSQNDYGKLKGQLKLTLNYSKDVFCVMVHHVRGLSKLPNGQEPSTYVKVYLKPDEQKETKRKTKVVKKSCHPTFMEMLEYRMPKSKVCQRTLRATVWNYDALQENEFLGGVELDLSTLKLEDETTEWYPLLPLSNLNR